MTDAQLVTTEAYPPIPNFEGKAVEATRLKIANSAVLDLPDHVLQVDDIIHILVEARVTSVSHDVHNSTGALIRHQTARPLAARIVPFNPEYDDGVIRAD